MSNLWEDLVERLQDKFHKAALGVAAGSFLCELATKRKTKEMHSENMDEEDDFTSAGILAGYSRFGVEINVSPEPLCKLIIVNITYKKTKWSKWFLCKLHCGYYWVYRLIISP